MHNGPWVKDGEMVIGPMARGLPFSRETAFFSGEKAEPSKIKISDLALPPILQTSDGRYVAPKSNLHQFFSLELDVSRLNKIQKHLWLAGLPKGARPLHRQLVLNRQIVITEQADLHLVWQKSRIFVKPLPLFLLVHGYWRDHICIDESLFMNACGFLISYAWLVCYRSDLDIAHRLGLVPKEIGWQEWTSLVEDFLQHIDICSPDAINPRYRYGELRLTRLNWIYRCSFWQMDFRDLRRGYFQGPEWYTQFLRDHFGWLIAAFAYVSIVLSAMQVGLGTQDLGENNRFQDASYGFTVFAIAMPAIVVGVIMIASAIVVFFNVKATRHFNRRVANDPGPYIGINHSKS